jgi:hypothetical protein
MTSEDPAILKPIGTRGLLGCFHDGEMSLGMRGAVPFVMSAAAAMELRSWITLNVPAPVGTITTMEDDVERAETSINAVTATAMAEILASKAHGMSLTDQIAAAAYRLVGATELEVDARIDCALLQTELWKRAMAELSVERANKAMQAKLWRKAEIEFEKARELALKNPPRVTGTL